MFYSKANREIKNSAFIDYFEEPQRFLSLYNAVSGLSLPLDTLVDFMESINTFRRQGNDYNTAVVMAVKHCISENIMADYLEEHSSEVINMLTEEFDMGFALEVRYEEEIV